MKIVVVSDVSPVQLLGGGERVLWEQTSRLCARKHVVKVVSRTPDGGVPGDLVHDGVAVHHFPVDRRSLAAFIRTSVLGARRAVESEIAAHGADVLHFHQPIGAFGVLTSTLGRRLPSLYTFHSPAPLEYRSRTGMSGLHRGGLVGRAGAALLWTLERASLKRASRIQVLSDFSARLLWDLYGISGERIVKIVGGADVERFHPSGTREAQRQALGLPGDRPLLFTLRNLEPRMGLDTLIRAMATVRERFPRVLLLLGGSGSLRPLLETITISLGLSEHVRFLGFVPERDLPAYYGAADAFVLPTRELEGFGLVTVEALACGTPVLGTPVGATPEILEPLDRSLLFADVGPTAIADGIGRFLERSERDPAGVRDLRRACVAYAERQYGWSRSVDALEDMLGTLTEKNVAATGAVRCVACDRAARLRWFRHRGEDYRACPACGTSVAAKLPTAAGLRHFYEVEYPARFVRPEVPASRLDLFDELVARLGPPRGRRRLLDVGCGPGHFVASAAAAGWRAVGLELAAEMCAAARTTAACDVVQSDSVLLPFDTASMDAVTFINVLDHLVDPYGALAEAHRVLAPDGLLVIRVPNGAFHRRATQFFSMLGRRGWLGKFGAYPVFHVFGFTARGLRRLVERSGFHVLSLRNSPLSAEGPSAADSRAPGLPRWLRGAGETVAATLHAVTASRCLAAPSIELYARRLGDEEVPPS